MATAAETNEDKVIFEKGGVFIHTHVSKAEDDALLPGKVIITEKKEGIFLEWLADLGKPPNKDTEWTVLEKEETDKANQTRFQAVHKFIINFDVKDLKSLKRSKPSLGWSYLIFILKCGTTYPPLHFHQGGTKQLIKELEKYLVIKKSATDSCLYLVREPDPNALTTSFDELKLFEHQAHDVVSKFFKDPYTTTLSGFSKVTGLVRDAFQVPQGENQHSAAAFSYSSLLGGDFEGLDLHLLSPGTEDQGFEFVETREELIERPDVKRDSPVSAPLWSHHMDKEGKIQEKDQLLQAIFKGGIEPSIRNEVWKFLLGYYCWDSTYHQRTEERKNKVDSYFAMKLQWKSISDEQEKRFGIYKERKNLIDKDVTRTDRTHQFFQGDNNPNISVLYDILMTYCMYNFDLGYVQGMSDLLAPILVVMENEVDAFWCFAGFMDKVWTNFEMDQTGMKRQLSDLHTLVKFVDPELCNYLESHESSNMYFCFRWLLILYKREFSFSDIMRLWEVLWTTRPCMHFHMLISVAILDTEKSTLIENRFGFTEILKHINDLSGTIDLEDTLKKAEGIYLQLKAYKNIPRQISEIVGLEEAQQSGVTPLLLSPGSESSSVCASPSHTTPVGSTPSTPERRPKSSHNPRPPADRGGSSDPEQTAAAELVL